MSHIDMVTMDVPPVDRPLLYLSPFPLAPLPLSFSSPPLSLEVGTLYSLPSPPPFILLPL